MKTMDPFAILGIEPGVSMQEIRQAWLDQLQAWHPDIPEAQHATHPR